MEGNMSRVPVILAGNQKETAMSRIPVPATISDAPAASQPLLEAVKKQLGVAPNLFRLVSHSPAALQGYVGLSGALSKGALPAATRERIALAIAEINGCDYCLSAHSYLGQNLAKISPQEVALNRNGESGDTKADAAVRFATKVVRERGHVTEAEIKAVRTAGFSDSQIVEIIALVAENCFTNFLNEAAKTDIDFPVVRAAKAA